MPKSVSSSLIILIPKKSNPMTFADFRLICLCTFVNKIFTKIMANRMRPLLPLLISPKQSEFVKGREISENVLLAQEIVASINKKVRGHNCLFMKAFDRVS